MAVHETTVIIAPGNSSNYAPINWSSFDSGANNVYVDMNGKTDAKMLVLYAAQSTAVAGIWIGTCDSRSSQTSKVYPYAAGKLGPMKINTSLVADANARSKFRSTVAGDTDVWAIFCLGPFETMRFADSQGRIKIARAAIAGLSTVEHQIAAILLP